MRKHEFLRSLAAILLVTPALCWLTLATPALAAWPSDALNGVPVCTETHDQYLPLAVPDGVGGVIVAWRDTRAGSTVYDQDIYAQHVLASGTVDPAWPVGGLAVCNAPSDQEDACIVSDGAGGAIVAWQDYRGGGFSIYAHHALASGTMDPAWPANGRALCANPSYQITAKIVSDGAGGAIISWQGLNDDFDIYAQHVVASGAIDSLWPPDGTVLCASSEEQRLAVIAPDGAGGAIVAWNDARGDDGPSIYAQHVSATGSVDANWPLDGLVLSAGAANIQYSPAITPDGVGGALVTWMDARSGVSNDIYAQHVLAAGVVDPAWPDGGLEVCTDIRNELLPVIAGDGSGGAFIAWQGSPAAEWSIYAHHVLSTGTVDPLWPVNGFGVCTLPGAQSRPSIAADGTGGAIVAWEDERGFDSDVYALRLKASGAPAPSWPANGRAVSAAPGFQGVTSIVPDASSGTVVVWTDRRSGTNFDVYAQRVGPDGALGLPPTGVEDAAIMDAPSFAPPFPNPARAFARLRFVTPRTAPVRLDVYDAAGRRVRGLDRRTIEAGEHTAVWDLRSSDGRTVRAGVYFARLSLEGRTLTQRIVVDR